MGIGATLPEFESKDVIGFPNKTGGDRDRDTITNSNSKRSKSDSPIGNSNKKEKKSRRRQKRWLFLQFISYAILARKFFPLVELELSPPLRKATCYAMFWDPNSTRPDDPELELYTIPTHSSWFSWSDIHETERLALKPFFDGSSISRTPKIYKEYRDFIINKYREDPSRKLTFTEIRKSLVGDVSLLHKVFRFLENWGLINFGLDSGKDGLEKGIRVQLEDGAPIGVRVVETPNLLRPIAPPPAPAAGIDRRGSENGVKLPPLSSYSDVYAKNSKKLRCSNCEEQCDSGYYEYTKGDYTICAKCYESEKFGDDFRLKEDFRLNDDARNKAVWTEAETLLLLESVMKHGDDWELVAKDVQTKTKLDCISKLIELPLGDFLMDSANKKNASSGSSVMITNGAKQVPLEHQGKAETEDKGEKSLHEDEKNGDTENQESSPKRKREEGKGHGDEKVRDARSQEPPLKRMRAGSVADASSSLMNQVALISAMVGPDITAAAAEATISALSNETSCPREIFGVNGKNIINGLQPLTTLYESERPRNDEDSEVENSDLSAKKNDVPLPLQIRAAVATGLGAAAARAKILAEQEEREIEHLLSSMIDAQVKKLQSKLKRVEDLEELMEKEHDLMAEVEERIVEERIDVLRKTFSSGMSKWREHSSVKPQI